MASCSHYLPFYLGLVVLHGALQTSVGKKTNDLIVLNKEELDRLERDSCTQEVFTSRLYAVCTYSIVVCVVDPCPL